MTVNLRIIARRFIQVLMTSAYLSERLLELAHLRMCRCQQLITLPLQSFLTLAFAGSHNVLLLVDQTLTGG